MNMPALTVGGIDNDSIGVQIGSWSGAGTRRPATRGIALSALAESGNEVAAYREEIVGRPR